MEFDGQEGGLRDAPQVRHARAVGHVQMLMRVVLVDLIGHAANLPVEGAHQLLERETAAVSPRAIGVHGFLGRLLHREIDERAGEEVPAIADLGRGRAGVG